MRPGVAVVPLVTPCVIVSSTARILPAAPQLAASWSLLLHWLPLPFVPTSVQLSAVVTEKELGLRQALRTMGMMDSAFWLSWMAVEVRVLFAVT